MCQICSIRISFGATTVQDHLLDHVYDQSYVIVHSSKPVHEVSKSLQMGSLCTKQPYRCHDLQQRMVFEPRKRKSRLRVYIVFCAICAALSAVVTVMEAYALLALQFCDGEDLISLYWSTWTMVQVGSLIAIIGIILALMHTLKDRQHP